MSAYWKDLKHWGVTYEPPPGCYLPDACEVIAAEATRTGRPTTFRFNGVSVYVEPGESAADAEREYYRQRKALGYAT